MKIKTTKRELIKNKRIYKKKNVGWNGTLIDNKISTQSNLSTIDEKLKLDLQDKYDKVDSIIIDDHVKMEAVNHPSHYGGEDNPYEAIKVIEAWGLCFPLGNAVKYISRAGKKDPSKELEDLKKAQWYIQRKIEQLEKNRVEKFCKMVNNKLNK